MSKTNIDEARKMLSECDGWIGEGNEGGEIQIDGIFTLEELEALIMVERFDASKKPEAETT